MTPVESEVPPARTMRLAGALYVLVIAGGLFNEAAVMGTLAGKGPEATAAAIAASESLWRWGMGVHLLYLPCAVVMNVLVYKLLRSVEPTLALLALVFALVALAVEASFILQLFVPVALAGDGGSFAAIAEAERQALAYLSIRLYAIGFGLALFFFSGFCTLVGILILRSGHLPKFVGVLMLAAGMGYMVSGLLGVVAPPLSSVLSPWLLAPCFVGEASVALWLLITGAQGREQARAPARSRVAGAVTGSDPLHRSSRP